MRARRLVFSVLTLGALAGTAAPAVIAATAAPAVVAVGAAPAVYMHT